MEAATEPQSLIHTPLITFIYIFFRVLWCKKCKQQYQVLSHSMFALNIVKVMPLSSIEKTWKWRFFYSIENFLFSIEKILVVTVGVGFMNCARDGTLAHPYHAYSNTHRLVKNLHFSYIINFTSLSLENFLLILRQTLFPFDKRPFRVYFSTLRHTRR